MPIWTNLIKVFSLEWFQILGHVWKQQIILFLGRSGSAFSIFLDLVIILVFSAIIMVDLSGLMLRLLL